MAPDSLKSESCGLFSSLSSTFLESCDNAMTGIFNSLARALRPLVISETSLTHYPL